MSQKTTLRALLGAGIASAMVAASAAGAFATTSDNETPKPVESGNAEVQLQEQTTAPEDPTKDEVEETDVTDGEEGAESEEGPESGEEGSGEADGQDDDDDVPPAEEDPAEGTPAEEVPSEEELQTGDGDDDDLTVEEVIEAPEVKSSAEGQMDAKAEWTVTKKVVKDTKKVTGKPGSTAKVPYRVEASATGVLSNIKITGDMSVKNADERDLVYTLEAMLLEGYDPKEQDDLFEVLGAKCSFKGTDADPNMPGFQVKVASGQSLDVTYTCTAPTQRVSGPAFAVSPFSFWTYVSAMTTMGFDEEAWSEAYALVDFGDLKLKDQLVDIYDVNAEDIGGDEVLLGTADAADGKHVYEYTMNVSIPNKGCYDFDNVALAVNADDEVLAEDNATIEGCAEAPEASKTEVKPAGVIVAGSGGSQGGGLAATGAESTMVGAAGAGLVALGALAFGLSRRARKA